MNFDIMAQLALIIPELLLALGALTFLMLGAFSGHKANYTIMMASIALLAVSLVSVLFFSANGSAFDGALLIDPFGRFMKVITLIGAICALIMAGNFSTASQLDKPEFPILVIFSTLGMMLMISANNMLAFYLGLELQSLALYVLAAFNRDNLRSSEAGLKYFVLGALSSGILLYGMSLVYGYTGQIGFSEIASSMSQTPPLGLIFGVVFILAGVAFKISAVPFHMWTPDVYEGAPTPVTAFFATAPKVAAMAVIVRLVVETFAPLASVDGAMPAWQQIIIFLSLASMLLASFAAIGQSNIKRLMAYSSISHMGYVLVGLSAGTVIGITSVLIYLAIYIIMTVGCFAFILSMRTRDGYVENIYDLGGLARANPFMATMFTIQLFSLAGIPVLAGFFAKWYTFAAAVQAGFVPLAVIGLLTSVVSAFYYLRVIKIMWFDELKTEFQPLTPQLNMLLGLSGAFVLFYGLFGGWIYIYAFNAASSLF